VGSAGAEELSVAGLGAVWCGGVGSDLGQRVVRCRVMWWGYCALAGRHSMLERQCCWWSLDHGLSCVCGSSYGWLLSCCVITHDCRVGDAMAVASTRCAPLAADPSQQTSQVTPQSSPCTTTTAPCWRLHSSCQLSAAQVAHLRLPSSSTCKHSSTLCQQTWLQLLDSPVAGVLPSTCFQPLMLLLSIMHTFGSGCCHLPLTSNSSVAPGGITPPAPRCP
jgi:hypothetical protein